MTRSRSHLTTTPKRDKNSTHKKTEVCECIFELSTAVVKVDIKIINAKLTQNQDSQCVSPALNVR